MHWSCIYAEQLISNISLMCFKKRKKEKELKNNHQTLFKNILVLVMLLPNIVFFIKIFHTCMLLFLVTDFDT